MSKSVVMERSIRPWLEDMSNHYMGGVEEKFIALVEKKLLSQSHPDKIIKILVRLLDVDAEEFVIRLWKKLCLEYLKLENGLVWMINVPKLVSKWIVNIITVTIRRSLFA